MIGIYLLLSSLNCLRNIEYLAAIVIAFAYDFGAKQQISCRTYIIVA